MSLYDFRTKPESQWTYYVVDHLPTAANIFRYDTPEEAIACYKLLDPSLQSAIGSSIGGVHEIDLIHRRSHNTPVYLKDSEQIEPGLWRGSPEARDALVHILDKLNVTHELNSQIFGGHLPSVLVDLDRNLDKTIDRYYESSILFPDRPRQYTSTIKEVYAQGHGWVKTDAFLRMLQNGIPRDQRGNLPDYYVNRLSVRYMDMKTGYFGQADVSPREYTLLCEKTEQLLAPDRLAQDLYDFLSGHSPDAHVLGRGSISHSASDFRSMIKAGRLGEFQKEISQVLARSGDSEDTRQQARQLYSRIMALTPKEFQRQPSLTSKIKQAKKVSSQQQDQKPKVHAREEEHSY